MREREERDRRTPSSRRNKRACFGDIYIEEVEGIILAMSKTNRFQVFEVIAKHLIVVHLLMSDNGCTYLLLLWHARSTGPLTAST